jgi:magnesium transporter
VSEIVDGLGSDTRKRVAALRREGRFFWIDTDAPDIRSRELEEALGIPEHAMKPLLDFNESTPPSRKFHADGDHVIFTMSCFLAGGGAEGGDGVPQLLPVEVHVLVHGDYLLTVHREPLSLPQNLSSYTPEGRSEQYVVYAVLDAMVATGFDALNDAELTLEGLQMLSTNMRGSRVRMATLRKTNADLSAMRRRIGPQRGIFERISEEIGRVKGLESDSEKYFERIYEQLNRLVNAIDAASDSMAKLIDLRLNETMYWLTVVATIFLPLTFVTGFFGMNFTWMVDQIDTQGAFILLGLGAPVLGAVLAWLAIQRRGTPVEPDSDAVKRFVETIRKPRVRRAAGPTPPPGS